MISFELKNAFLKLFRSDSLVSFHSIPEEECVNIYGFDISERKELEGKFRVLQDEVQKLRERLEEPEELQRAVSEGDLDALIMTGPEGEMVFTLTGADNAYRTLVEIAIEDIVIIDAELKIIYTGKRLINKTGYRKEEVIGRSWLDFIDEESKIVAKQGMKQILHGIDESYELKLICKNSSPYWALIGSKPLFDNDGKFKGVLGMLTDITERKQMETALKRNEQRLNDLLNSIQDGFFELDHEWRFTYINHCAAHTIGFEPEELIGEHVWERTPFIVKSKYETMLREVMETHRSTSFEVKSWTTDNWYEISVYPLTSGISVLWRDITDRKHVEETLQRERSLLESVMETTDVMLVFLDSQFNFMWVNSAYAETCQMKPEELIGKNHFALYPHEENEAIFRQVRDTGDGVFYKDKPFVFPDQPERGVAYWDWSLSPVKDTGRNVTGLVFSLRETTKYKETEDAIKENEEKYRSLFSNMSEGFGLHEIILDADGKPCDYRFLEINDAFEKLTGIAREKALGKTVTELLPDIEPYWIETYGRVALTGEAVRFENYSTPLGRWYEVYSFSPRKNQFAAMFGDINERKQAEEALRESEARHQIAEAIETERQRLFNVLETLPVYVILLSPDYHVPFANHFFEERFGKSEGRRCYEYLFQLNEPCENCETYKVLKTGVPNRWEWTGPDGHNYDIYDYPFKDSDGSTLIMEVGIDITEIKQAQAAVQSERQRLFDVLETLPALICLLTADHHVAFINRSFREKFGDSDGRHCYDYCFRLTKPCEFCEAYQVLETGQPHSWEVNAPDGSMLKYTICHSSMLMVHQ